MEFRAEEWLPEGFVQRVFEDQNRGLIVPQWAQASESEKKSNHAISGSKPTQILNLLIENSDSATANNMVLVKQPNKQDI
ncbi:hypothetical protein H5410_054485 [Solanum commersonii]|uniref:Uncharacterized protein n=1 Tax=Solanum commersonii TaxID=4109 RepID=A0A9J5WG65_SOLCO|nr:hypothetical protein H5410_054485 [Solanum commersonii]